MAGARDYQAGDSVRHLHWKATAHRGMLQTKLFDPSASPHWMVCLNTQTLERLYEGVIVDYLETAIVVAASIAHAGLEARRSVGLTSNSTIRESSQWAYLPASRHAQQNTHILEALAQLTHPPLISFEKMLRLAAPRFPFGASLFVVTPLVTDAILDALWEMRRAGASAAIDRHRTAAQGRRSAGNSVVLRRAELDGDGVVDAVKERRRAFVGWNFSSCRWLWRSSSWRGSILPWRGSCRPPGPIGWWRPPRPCGWSA